MSVKINDIYQLKKDVKELQNAVPNIPEVDLTSYYTKTETDAKIATGVANIVDSAPETLNTLKELSKALGDDPNFATTVTTQLGNKAEKSHKHNFSELEGAPPAVDMSNYYNKVESDNRFIGTDDTFTTVTGQSNNFSLRTSSTINNYKIYGLTSGGKSVGQDDGNQIRIHGESFSGVTNLCTMRGTNNYNGICQCSGSTYIPQWNTVFTPNLVFGGRSNIIRWAGSGSSGVDFKGLSVPRVHPTLNVPYILKFDFWVQDNAGNSTIPSFHRLILWENDVTKFDIISFKVDGLTKPIGGQWGPSNAITPNSWHTIELEYIPKVILGNASNDIPSIKFDNYDNWEGKYIYLDPASLFVNKKFLNTNVTQTIQLDAPLRSNGTKRDVIDSLNATLTRNIAADGTVLTTPVVTSLKCPSIPLTQGLNNVSIVNTLPTDIEFKYASSPLAGARLNGTDISIVNNRVTELFQSVNSGKTNLETAIIDKGGIVSKVGQVATFQELIDAIKLLKIDDNVGKQIIIDAIKKQIPNCPLTVEDTWEKISFYISIVGNIKLSFNEVISNIILNNPTINSNINIVNEKSIILNIGENINTQQLNSPTITDKLDIQLGTN